MDKQLVLAGKTPKTYRVRVTGDTVEETTTARSATAKAKTKSTQHPDEATALAAAEKLLRAKYRAGYAYLAPAAAPGEILHVSFGPGGGGGPVMDMSPDGKHVACVSITSDSMFGAKIHVVDVETGERRVVLERAAGTEQNFVHRVLFDRTGSRLVVALKFETLLVDLASGSSGSVTPLATIGGSNPFVAKPHFDGARRRLVVFGERVVRVLDADRLATSGDSSSADSSSGDSSLLLEVAVAQNDECRYAALSPSGKRLAVYLLTANTAPHVAIYDVDTGALRTTRELAGLVDMVQPLDDDETLLTSPYHHKGPVAIDLATGERRWQFSAPGEDTQLDTAHGWAVSHDGTRFAVARRSAALYTWPAREPIELAAPDEAYGAACVCFSADDTRLAITCNGLNIVYRI